MGWLFVKQLRPFVLLAGAASLLLNLALLMPAIYMMQVFDRVFASRSVETLVMLTRAGAAGAGARLLHGHGARARAGLGRPRARSAPVAGRAGERAARGRRRRRAGRTPTRCATSRSCAPSSSGSGIQALFDAPWLPIYLAGHRADASAARAGGRDRRRPAASPWAC